MYGLIDTSTLTDIADAIREKLGVQTTYKPSEMSEAIESISGGGITPTGTKNITANGTYDVAAFASAEVNVPQSGITPTGTKQVSITSNGTTTEDVTAYADAQITVNVPTGSTPTGTKNISITQNGTTTEDVANYANAQISVNVVNQDYEDALVALGVTEDLTDSIEALTTYANGVTGESDTNLSDAVHTLGSGYGGGGSFYSGTYTPEQDTAGPSFDVGAANISHFLIYATTDPRESGKKWFIYAHSKFNSNIVGIASNNTGTSSTGNPYENNWFTKNGTVVTCASGVSGATTPGYFKAGVTYQWFAW